MTRDESNLKLPNGATKVFTGVLHDTYQWPQKVYDGSIVTFEMLARADSAIIIPTDTEGFFYINYEQQPERKPFLSVPSGRIEAGEDPLSAAKRELEEETALVSDSWTQITQYSPSTKIDWNIYVFNAKNCTKSGRLNFDPGEIIESRRVDRQEFIDFLLDPSSREIQIKLMFLEHYYRGTHEQWLDSLI